MAGAIADIKNSAGKALGALKAIGFSGQMHGAVVLDRWDKPIRPAILHNDGRAYREAEELARDYPDLPPSRRREADAGFHWAEAQMAHPA